MAKSSFHNEPYDPGTLRKLKIFELYAQEWIPVFVSQPDPPFTQLHVFDLFSGPGTDPIGTPGSPLRILNHRPEPPNTPLAAETKVTVEFPDVGCEHATYTGSFALLRKTGGWDGSSLIPFTHQSRSAVSSVFSVSFRGLIGLVPWPYLSCVSCLVG